MSIRKKLVSVVVGLLVTNVLMAQDPAKAPGSYTYSSDSLTAKRSLLTTVILKDNKRLSSTDIRSLLTPTPGAMKAYQWGKVLQPVGPLLILSGIALGYMGIKGEQKMGLISGTRTPGNYYPDDILVEYTKRSVPKTLAGLGLLVAGFYMIERSNELTSKAVTLFNKKPAPIRTLSYQTRLTVGLTTTGNFGFEGHF